MPYARPIVTIDIDGVLADTGYVPKGNQRSYSTYTNAKPFPDAYELLHWFYQKQFEVWFLSARSFPGAQALTEAWVHHNFGNLNPWYHKKVLTGLHCESAPKHTIANELHSVLHIDDDWRVFTDYDEGYHLIPFGAVPLWINNWKDKSSIPIDIEHLVDNEELLSAPNLKEALEIVQSITPDLLGKTTRK